MASIEDEASTGDALNEAYDSYAFPISPLQGTGAGRSKKN